MARRSAAAESNHRVGRAHLKPMLIISGPQLGATGAFRPSRGAGCTDAGPNRGAPAAPMFIKNRAMSARFHPKFRTPPAPDFFPMRDPFIEPNAESWRFHARCHAKNTSTPAILPRRGRTWPDCGKTPTMVDSGPGLAKIGPMWPQIGHQRPPNVANIGSTSANSGVDFADSGHNCSKSCQSRPNSASS